MKERVVLIGAGSAMFTRGLLADLIRGGWEADLALVDIDPTALATAEGLAGKMIEAKRSGIRLSASQDRRDVLPGASAVICTVGVGGRRAWEQDILIPRKYGIHQPVGDSTMPGGTSRALRMIPAMVAIAEDVLDLAPSALFFNYGNPMPAVCRGIRKATGANVAGLCHGVVGIARYIARALGVDLADLRYTATGINHLTWFTEIRVRGEDAMPRMRAMIGEKIAAGDNPFCWKLLEIFGAYPAVGDRHVTEFFPQLARSGVYKGKKLGLDHFSMEETIARGDRIYQSMQEDASSPDPLPADYFERISGEHEQVLEIIRDIRSDAGTVYSVNLPNTGQVPNLAREAILESPAIATASGLRSLSLPPLPPGIAGTLATTLQWIETTVDAALEGSRQKFVQALVLDGSVDSLETAEALADDLLAGQARYLPQFETVSAARAQLQEV